MESIKSKFKTIVRKTGKASLGLTFPSDQRSKFEAGQMYEFEVKAKKVVIENDRS